MSTNSTIAIGTADEWKGRYCHWDGYPSWNGRILWNEVKAAGVEALAAFLSDDGRGAWGISMIKPGFLTDPQEMGWDRSEDGRKDANFRVFRDRPGEEPSGWTLPFDPETGTGGEDGFLYVVTTEGLYIKDGDESTLVPWDAAEPDWDALEEELTS